MCVRWKDNAATPTRRKTRDRFTTQTAQAPKASKQQNGREGAVEQRRTISNPNALKQRPGR